MRNGYLPRLFCLYTMEDTMANIKEHMKIIGKDGALPGLHRTPKKVFELQ